MRNIISTILSWLILFAPSVFAQDPIRLGSDNGVTMYSVSQDAPGRGFQSAKIVLKVDNDAAPIVSLENIKIEGDVVQAWSSLGGPNALATEASPIYDSSWTAFDTHLLISEDMILGRSFSTFEENDGTLGDLDLPTALAGISIANIGIGPTRVGSSNETLILDPLFQINELAIAQIVSTGVAFASVDVISRRSGNSNELNESLFRSIPVVFPDPPFCDTSSATFCFDFDDQLNLGGTISGDAQWQERGGLNDTPYLSITDDSVNQRGSFTLPLDGNRYLSIGARTGEATSTHDVENIEFSHGDGYMSFSAAVRIGGGPLTPRGHGISFSIVGPEDPTIVGDGNGYAGINGETNMPEEGTTTGISISIDETQTGPLPFSCETNVTNDVVGISLRIDGEIVGQAYLPHENGELENPVSLQTGPSTGNISDLGWATLTLEAPTQGANLGNTNITWKGGHVEFGYCPEPRTSSSFFIALFAFAVVQRHVRK